MVRLKIRIIQRFEKHRAETGITKLGTSGKGNEMSREGKEVETKIGNATVTGPDKKKGQVEGAKVVAEKQNEIE